MNTTDAAALVEQLDAAIIRRQLAELEKQRRALLVLLRAAVARERTEGVTRPAAEEDDSVQPRRQVKGTSGRQEKAVEEDAPAQNNDPESRQRTQRHPC